MRQIRARIRDKRGADYTEAEVRELASVKLDRFLDPRAVRSDLLGHFKRQHQPAPLFLAGEEFPPEYTFDPDLTLGSARDLPRRILRGIRKLLSPLLKLFVNMGAITHPLHLQPAINTKHRELFARVSQRLQTRDELDALNFEMFNNLVVETTRLGIEVKNLRMLVESLSTRLDFDERRARALEGVVQYRPGTPLAPPPAPAPAAIPAGADDAESAAPAAAGGAPGTDPGDGRGPRRRRRRRGRRRGGLEGGQPGAPGVSPAAGEPAGDDGLGDDGDDGGPESGDGAGYDDGPDDAADAPTAPIAALPTASIPAPPNPPATPGSIRQRRRRTHSPSRRRRLGRTVKLAVVVQRYGADISGGAELHARYVAEMLARRHRVEVLTTCAHDYVTWKAHYAEGTETINGVPVRRFPVARERDPQDFGQRSTQVFERRHSVADEIAWLDSEGPTSPALIDYIGQQADAFDFFLFFSYRYYHAWHGVRRVPHKAILVPTAERDAALGLSIFAPVFRAARALMYNSPEERAIIQAVSGNTSVPGVVVGIGSDLPRETAPDRFRRKYDVSGPFVIYVGRIDANKGCAELFDYFGNYRPRLGQQLSLILAGTSILPIPAHPRIRHLGFISDRDKFDAIAASEALIMPSRFESLSMVALEAWGLGRPVLANGRCDVLRGQTIRSRAGLYYDDFPEFAEALFTLTSNRPLHQAFGENGRRFYERHYAWPVIQRKYEDMLGQLSRANATPAAAEALPGWLARRRRTLAPAQEVVDGIAKGPVAYNEPAAPADAHARGQSSGQVSGSAGPAPRPSPVAGRQAVRSGPHGRGRRPQGHRPDRPDRPQGGRPGQQGAQAGGGKGGPGAPGKNEGGPGKNGGGQKGSRDRQDGRRGQNRQGRQRRPPRRNG